MVTDPLDAERPIEWTDDEVFNLIEGLWYTFRNQLFHPHSGWELREEICNWIFDGKLVGDRGTPRPFSFEMVCNTLSADAFEVRCLVHDLMCRYGIYDLIENKSMAVGDKRRQLEKLFAQLQLFETSDREMDQLSARARARRRQRQTLRDLHRPVNDTIGAFQQQSLLAGTEDVGHA